MTRPCSGCERRDCDGRCYFECTDGETISAQGLADLIAKYGSQLTRVQGDPLLPENRRDAA